MIGAIKITRALSILKKHHPPNRTGILLIRTDFKYIFIIILPFYLVSFFVINPLLSFAIIQ